jgi:O-antigen/teichoic acid export membrane protein
MQSLGGILLRYMDRFLIASLVSVSALAYYTVCLLLAEQIHAVLARAFAFLFPMSSAAGAGGDSDQLRRIYFKSLNFITTVAIGLGLPLFLFANKILSLWMGVEFAAQATLVLQVLVFSLVLMATSIVPYYYLNGVGYVRLNAVMVLLSGALVALAALLLIPRLGIIGACCARLASLPVSITSRAIIHRRVFRDRRWYAALAILGPVFVAFGVAAAISYWLPLRQINTWQLVIGGVATGALGLVLGWGLSRFMNSSCDVLTRSMNGPTRS